MTTVLAQATNGGEFYLILGFALFAVAAALFLLEMFVPSGGLIGLLCGVAVIGSIVSFFKYSTAFGAFSIGAYLLLGPLGIIAAFKLWTGSSIGRRMVLGGDTMDSGETPEEAMYASERARIARHAELRALIGAEGVAETSLRPVGTVRINDQRLDAIAESGIIEPGSPIVVSDVYDNQVKVRAL